VERDFSFIFEDAVSFGQMRTRSKARYCGVAGVPSVEIFRGGTIGTGNIRAAAAKFQSGERTLREEEVALCQAKLWRHYSVGGVQRA